MAKKMSPRQKLVKRIKREFKTKKFIGDIQINDDEFALLVQQLQLTYRLMYRQPDFFRGDEVYCVTLVQIGIRYYDGGFWPHVARLIDSPLFNMNHTVWMGRAFMAFMRSQGKVLSTETKAFGNILMHGFVSDKKANDLFDFLYAFYRIDLLREINNLDAETMSILIENIKRNDNTARTYQIVEHTADAIRNNERGGKIRLRRYLKLIDRAFWEEDLPRSSANRLMQHFIDWSKQSHDFVTDRALSSHSYGRKRIGNKPYLKFMTREFTFRLVLPEELVHIDECEASSLFWHIQYNEHNEWIPAKTYAEGVTGITTEQTGFTVNAEDIFSAFSFELTNGEKIYKKGIISGDVIRFFDVDGDRINPDALRPGVVYSFSSPDFVPQSEAAQGSQIISGLCCVYYQLQDDDLIILPDSQALHVGKKLAEGLLKRGSLPGTILRNDDTDVEVYSAVPSLLVKIAPRQQPGTALYINNEIHRLWNDSPAKGVHVFDLLERTPEQGVYIQLSEFGISEDGLYSVCLDVPNDHSRREWDFAVIKGLEYYFDGLPYVFKDKGMLTVPASFDLAALKPMDKVEEAEGQRSFAFDLDINEPYYMLRYQNYQIGFRIPAFSYCFKGEEWRNDEHMPIWKDDFQTLLQVRYPGDQIGISLDEDGNEDEDDDDPHEIIVSKNRATGLFECDLNPLKSWFGKRVAVRRLFIRLPDSDRKYKFLDVFTKSVFIGATLSADLNADILHCEFDIHGKATYYADILLGDECIAEKQCILDGKLDVMTELRSGLYKVDVYEAEADDTGFDEPDYEYLGSKTMHLIHPGDLSGSHLHITRLSRKDTDSYLYLKREYRIFDLKVRKDLGRGIYDGKMVVTSHSGQYREDFPVRIEYADLNQLTKVFVYFYDDYGDYVELLYDSDRHILVREEECNTGKALKYRRYSPYLNDDEFEFDVEYIEKPEKLEEWVLSEYYARHAAEIAEQEKKMQKQKLIQDDHLSVPIEKMDLSIRSYSCLHRANILTSTEIAQLDRIQLLGIRNLGRNNAEEIIEKMRLLGYDWMK